MRNLAGSVLATATLIILANVANATEGKELRIAIEGSYPPFSQVCPDGKPTGFDVDIAQALCKEMGYEECPLVLQNWDGIIPGLIDAKKYDAIVASMSMTKERKEQVAFTDKYYHTPTSFFGRKESGIEINDASMQDKTVGVQRATVHDKFLSKNYANIVKIKRYATQDEAYLDLIAGRVDLLLADRVAIDYGFLNTAWAKQNYDYVGPDFRDTLKDNWEEPVTCKDIKDPSTCGEFFPPVGIALRKDQTDLLKKFNKAIAAIRANGTYREIQDKYFNFPVYGETSNNTESSSGRHGSFSNDPLSGAGENIKVNDICDTQEDQQESGYFPYILEGFLLTLKVAIASLLLSLVLGTLGAVAKLSKSAMAKKIAEAYTTIFRGVPALVLMLITIVGGQAVVNFITDTFNWKDINLDAFTAGVISIGFIFGASMTETIRGGILAIPRGQIEAGFAFGMNKYQVFRRITFPLMVRHALPSFGNNWLVMVKVTALVSVIGLQDMVFRATQAVGATHQPFKFYFLVAVLYLIITGVSDFCLRWANNRYSVGFVEGK